MHEINTIYPENGATATDREKRFSVLSPDLVRQPNRSYTSLETSMERNRNLRDYSMIFGFYRPIDFVNMILNNVGQGQCILEMGCGNAKAIAALARLSRETDGRKFFALDRNVPTLSRKKYPIIKDADDKVIKVGSLPSPVKYLQKDFSDTCLPDNSIPLIISVCSLFMYAENEIQLCHDAAELKRILKSDGQTLVVVDPLIVSTDPAIIKMQQTWTRNFRIQSPSRAKQHFNLNVFDLLKHVGLEVKRRIIPLGGTMIDDEVVLQIAHSNK